MSVKAEQDAVKKMRSPQSTGQSKILREIIPPANGSYGGTVDDDDSISTISHTRLNKESVVNFERPVRSEQISFISQNNNNRSQIKVMLNKNVFLLLLYSSRDTDLITHSLNKSKFVIFLSTQELKDQNLIRNAEKRFRE